MGGAKINATLPEREAVEGKLFTMKQIFLKALRHLLDPYDRSIERTPFDIVYGEKDGTVVNASVICTSSNFKNDTFNFKYPESGEVRTVHAQMLFRVNGMEVMI